VHDFSVGTPELVNRACEAAEAAFWSYGYSAGDAHAALLNAIADNIEARADQITEISTQENGPPAARLEGERGRTVDQLRLVASHVFKVDNLDQRYDPAMPDRQPLPRTDLTPCGINADGVEFGRQT
jgi:2,5-dioxopentanoate dehydrogenase